MPSIRPRIVLLLFSRTKDTQQSDHLHLLQHVSSRLDSYIFPLSYFSPQSNVSRWIQQVASAVFSPVLEHEEEGLAVEMAAEVEAVEHVELKAAQVHKVLIQLECPHVLRVEAAPGPVLLVPEIALALPRGHRLVCTPMSQVIFKRLF